MFVFVDFVLLILLKIGYYPLSAFKIICMLDFIIHFYTKHLLSTGS